MLVIEAGITELRWSKNQCRNSRNGGLSEWKAFFSMKKVPVFRPIEVNGSEWRPVGMAAWIVPWECRKIWGRGSRRSRKTWLVRRRTGAMLSIYIEPDGEFSERTILYLIIFGSSYWNGWLAELAFPKGNSKVTCCNRSGISVAPGKEIWEWWWGQTIENFVNQTGIHHLYDVVKA